MKDEKEVLAQKRKKANETNGQIQLTVTNPVTLLGSALSYFRKLRETNPRTNFHRTVKEREKMALERGRVGRRGVKKWEEEGETDG